MPARATSLKTYFFVFAALLALLALTVGVSFVNLGPFSFAASLTISLTKAALIMLVFMEVRHSRPITWLFAGAAFLWLVIMLTLTMSDYVTRSWVQPNWKNGVSGSNHVEFATPAR